MLENEASSKLSPSSSSSSSNSNSSISSISISSSNSSSSGNLTWGVWGLVEKKGREVSVNERVTGLSSGHTAYQNVPCSPYGLRTVSTEPSTQTVRRP